MAALTAALFVAVSESSQRGSGSAVPLDELELDELDEDEELELDELDALLEPVRESLPQAHKSVEASKRATYFMV